MAKTRTYMDKYRFTTAENQRFARANFTKLVHTNARFEGVNTTLPQTQTIMDGMSVAGVPVEDVLTKIAAARGCLKTGGIPDIEKVIQLVLRDFRTGRLGRFTLDNPDRK